MAHLRAIRQRLEALLLGEDRKAGLGELALLPAKALLGALSSALLSPDPLTRWRAAEAYGATVARLAETRREDARVAIRGLIWRLNEESGGIGWGAPEAMAESLARHRGLAEEYHRVLIGYIQDLPRDCTFIDHAELRRQCYWAVARLARTWPDLAAPAAPALTAGLSECDGPSRGLCCLALARLAPDHVPDPEAARQALAAPAADALPFELYDQGRLTTVRVRDMAETALARLGRPPGQALPDAPPTPSAP